MGSRHLQGPLRFVQRGDRRLLLLNGFAQPRQLHTVVGAWHGSMPQAMQRLNTRARAESVNNNGASDNGASDNGASDNGASDNGASDNGAAALAPR